MRYKYTDVPSILLSVMEMMRKVPPLLQWSVELTDDSGVAVPADFRIYVDNERERIILRNQLGFGRPAEQTDDTETHKFTQYLTVTIIEV